MKDIILFATGIVVGAMNGIAGGGMLVGFPVLVSTGLPAIMANATGALITLPGQLSSAYGYRQYLRKIPPYYALLLIPSIAGGAIGALLLRGTSPARFSHLVPFLVLFAVLLFTVQPFLHWHLKRHMRAKRKKLAPVLLIGLGLLPVSLYGGYFGAGYGFLMLAFLSFTNLRDTHKINAMKNVAAICIALAVIIALYGSHLINWMDGSIMGAGSLLGGYLGSIGAQKVSSHAIRIVVIAIGVCTTAYLLLRSY